MAIRYAAVPVGFVFEIILPIILTDPEGALSILSAGVDLLSGPPGYDHGSAGSIRHCRI